MSKKKTLIETLPPHVVSQPPKRLLQVVKQESEPRVHEEVGEPLQVSFYRYKDTKARVMEIMQASHPSQIFTGDVENDDEIFDDIENPDSTEVEDFNNILSQTPYTTDNNGVANYEKALTKNKDELENFRNYMSLKDHPVFQHLSSLFNGSETPEEINAKLKVVGDSLKAVGSEQHPIPSLPDEPTE